MEKDEKRKRGRLRLCTQQTSRSSRTQTSLPQSDDLLHGFLTQINKRDRHCDDISVYVESQDDKSEVDACKKTKNESFQNETVSEIIPQSAPKGISPDNKNRTLNNKNTSNVPISRSTHFLRTQKSTSLNANLDESLLQDFKSPKINQNKVQSKLTYLKEQKLAKVKKKSDSASNQSSHVSSVGSKRDDNDSFHTIKNDKIGEMSSVHKKPDICPSKEVDVSPESVTSSNTNLVEENQQRRGSLCPLCWKRFDRNQVLASHLKTCAVKHNMTTRQLLDAMELQQKQTAEREALGLPGLPTNQAAKKSTNKKDSGSTDVNLQLALALSASMLEAEEREQLQEEDTLLEAGLGDEVVAKQMTLLEKFGFTSNRPALPSIGGRPKSGKQKLKSFPTLLTRTQEERERRITEKVAIILMGEDDVSEPSEPVTIARPPTEPAVKSDVLLQYHKKNCDLWHKASSSPTKVDRSSYYVDGLSDFISPSKVVAGSKLKHLSQVPCRMESPGKELSHTDRKDDVNTPKAVYIESPPKSRHGSSEKSPKNNVETSQLVDKNSSKRLSFSPSHKQSNVSGFAETLITNWRSILNKKTMSDITIYVKDGAEIPAHELVLFVRCPSVLNDVTEELDRSTSKVSKKICWNNISHRVAVAFLEFIYCGSVSKILGLLEGLPEAQWLARKYAMTDLEQHLKMIANVRAKVCSQSDNSRSPQSVKRTETPNVSPRRKQEKEVSSRSKPYNRSPLTPTRTECVSPSFVTPKYKSPYNRSPCKKLNSPSSEDKSGRKSCATSTERPSSMVLPISLNIGSSEDGYRTIPNSDAVRDSIGSKNRSPDPFSDSRLTDGANCSSMNYDKENGQNESSQESRDNLDCLLSMMNKISPSQNTQMVSHVIDKDDPVACGSSSTIQLSDSPERVVETKDCSMEEHVSTSHLASPVAVSEEIQDCVLVEENGHHPFTESLLNTSQNSSNSEGSRPVVRSVENKRKYSVHSSSGDDRSSAKKKFRRGQTDSVKKNLFSSTTFKHDPDTVKEEQNNEIITYDLTQCSDESVTSRHSVVSSVFKGGSPLSNRSVSRVEDDCLSRIKDMIASDLGLKSEHDESIGKDDKADNQNCVKVDDCSADDSQKSKCSGQGANRSVDFDAERLGDFCADYEYDNFYSNYMNVSPPRTPLAVHESPNTKHRLKNQSLNLSQKSVRRSLSQNDVTSHRSSSPSPMRCLSQDSRSHELKSLSCDVSDKVICLDDSLSPDLPEVSPVTPSKPDESKDCVKSAIVSTGNTSLDAVKCLLEDSFMDQLNSSALWTKNIEPIGQSTSQVAACSTPKQGSTVPSHKTPIQHLTGGSSEDVTPMADYSLMKTPLLKKELHKFGLKPLNKRQAKLILRHIYNELHPWVPVRSSTEKDKPSGSPFKEPDADTRVPKSPTKRCLSKQLISPKKKSLEKCNSHSPAKKSPNKEPEDLDSGSECSMSSSQSSMSSRGSDYFTTADVDLDEPGLTQKDPDEPQTDLPTVVGNFIKSDPVLYQKVLLYEPIWLETLHADLKANQFKFKLDELMSYLDEQCITFRTAQQQTRNRARRSPKKKSKVTKPTQKEGTKTKKSKKAVLTQDKSNEDSSNS